MWRLSAYVGAAMVALVLALTMLILVFGGAILDGYGKSTAERAFAKAHPGSVLRIGKLNYLVSANCLIAQFVTLRTTNVPDALGPMKEGKVNYTRKPGDEFQQFAWFALRTGVLDIIGH